MEQKIAGIWFQQQTRIPLLSAPTVRIGSSAEGSATISAVKVPLPIVDHVVATSWSSVSCEVTSETRLRLQGDVRTVSHPTGTETCRSVPRPGLGTAGQFPSPVAASYFKRCPRREHARGSRAAGLRNAASNSLKKDKDTTTAELVTYVKSLATALRAYSENTAANVSAELKDPDKRQAHMKKLVEEGQAKAATALRLRKGWVTSPILSNTAWATKSNPAGITHGVPRMDRYRALAEHLLQKGNIKVRNESSK
ncbi:hypothetical protein DL765_006498 [Monosporascus sp. GIB2]|nr:hypothetical protein DL765_006498 [Monosporascus sp. GIB2]